MKKSDLKELPEYFEYYINLVNDLELADAFDKSLNQIEGLRRKGRRINQIEQKLLTSKEPNI